MVDIYCDSFRQVPKRITLDLDDIFDAVHGGQQLRKVHADMRFFISVRAPVFSISGFPPTDRNGEK